MKKLRLFSALVIAFSILIFPVVVNAAESSTQEACSALSAVSPNGRGCNDPAGPSIYRLIRLAVNLLSVVAGVIAVIMIIVSGLKFITSEGDPNSVKSAKSSLIYAVVGIVVVVFAQIIVKFVLQKTA